MIISQNSAAGMCGTGHNSTIQVLGHDEWHLVYHRFTYPLGITMGQAMGFHREVCSDKLKFAPDGSIRPVVSTQAGVGAGWVK